MEGLLLFRLHGGTEFAITQEGETRMEKPGIVTDEHLQFLDELRDSGVTNMYGAGGYVQDEFNIPMVEARAILEYWMESCSEHHSISKT